MNGADERQPKAALRLTARTSLLFYADFLGDVKKVFQERLVTIYELFLVTFHQRNMDLSWTLRHAALQQMASVVEEQIAPTDGRPSPA